MTSLIDTVTAKGPLVAFVLLPLTVYCWVLTQGSASVSRNNRDIMRSMLGLVLCVAGLQTVMDVLLEHALPALDVWSISAFMLSLVLYQVVLGATIIVYVLIFMKRDSRPTLVDWPSLRSNSGLVGIAFIVAALPVIWASYFDQVALSGKLASSLRSDIEVTLVRHFPFQSVFYSVSLWTIVPVYEELLYRGVILGAYRLVMPTWAAVILSAVGWIHEGQLGMRSIADVLVGVFFGFLYVRTKSLLVPIAIHATHNLFLEVAFFYWYFGWRFSWLSPLALAVSQTVVVAVVGFWFYRAIRKLPV